MTPDANGWLPSDKHMEAARATVAAIRARHECGKRSARSRTGKDKANASLRALEDIEPAIATALASAEREGMKRAAENDLPKERYPRAFFVLFADEGTNLRKWSSKPFEGATAYVLSEAGEKA